jgi:hypothetical protein
MSITMADIMTDVRDLLTETSTSLVDADLLTTINDIYLDMAVRGKCIKGTANVSTAASSRTVAADYVNVDAVEYRDSEGGKGLPHITPMQIGRGVFNGNYPHSFLQQGAQIAIDPIPDRVYPLTLYVSKYPTALMTSSTDVPETPQEMCGILELGVLAESLIRERRIADAMEIMGMYESELAFVVADTIEIVEDSREEMSFQFFSGRDEE